MVELTVPLDWANVWVEAKPDAPPTVLETSKPAGGVIKISFVSDEPETVKLAVELAVP